MATCRECLHCDVCYEWGNMLDPIHGGVVCDSFTPKSDYVKRERGFWEQGDYLDFGDICSRCQFDSVCEPCTYNFCPNCGADMRKEDNNKK